MPGPKKIAPKTKKPAAKTPAKAKSKKVAKPQPTREIWRCIVDGWVRYRGVRYEKGETMIVHPNRMTEADMEGLRKYFEPVPTEVMTGVSEPAELLDEGENHVRSDSE